MEPQRYKIVSDNDGHDYVICVEEEEAFYTWVEAVENYDYSGKGFDNCRMNCSRLTFTDPQGWK
jgi:hypothetical protein